MAWNDRVRKEFESYTDSNGSNYLHMICRHKNTPLEEIVEILHLCPALIYGVDSRNRTPLHIAAAYHMPSLIVRHLVHLYPEALKIQESEGKTPLILACDKNIEDFASLNEKNKTKTIIRCTRNEKYHQIVKELVRSVNGSITGASITDDDETNALEYALLTGVDQATIKLLQRVTAKESKHNFRRSKSYSLY